MQPARPELLALIQASKQEPDDDTSRLVLADWLAEHGEASDRTRGELIRLQCRAARMSHRGRPYRRVERRLRALERACVAEWRRHFPDGRLLLSFARGLLHAGAPLSAH